MPANRSKAHPDGFDFEPSKQRKSLCWLKHGTTVAIVLLVLLPVLVLLVWLIRMDFEVRATKRMLLEDVDHTAVLAACRALEMEKGDSWMGDDERLPSVISSLHSTYVVNEGNQIRIEFGGGFHHFGFVAVSEPGTSDRLPDKPDARELIEGLWFYEDTE